MQHPDEGTIHAWIDGQLSADVSAELETHVASCAECAALVAEARGLVAASTRIVSALDSVPAGVVPAAARRRSWYANTQLRAAAAVLLVAGASALVIRGSYSVPPAEDAGRVMATDVAEVRQDSKAMPEASAAIEQASPPPSAPAAKRNASGQRQATPPATRADGAGNTAARSVTGAGAAIRAESPAVAAPPAQATTTFSSQKAAEQTVTTAEPLRMRPVVVGGTAKRAESDAPALTLVRSDTTGSVTVSVYRVEPGFEVTLTETATVPSAPSTAAGTQRERRLQAAAPSPPLQRADMAAMSAVLMSISWTDSSSRKSYVLAGPVSRERLEALRKQIELTRR